MKLRILVALAWSLYLCTAWAADQLNSDGERVSQSVLVELNLARTEPSTYAGFVKERRRYYRARFLEIPGRIVRITREGVAAADEAIRFLERAKPLPPFELSEGMSQAAQDLVAYQAERGEEGHRGEDGSYPWDRVNRYGRWKGKIGENICYGENMGRDIVLSLIIDDGVEDRGHRTNIFDPEFRVVGIGFGPHPVYGHVCVIDFAAAYVESSKKTSKK